MPVFRVERNKGYTVMSNYHLRDKSLSLKAKGLLSQILSLPEDWDYTLSGLCYINRESKDAIRTAVNELERAGYIERRQTTDESGKFSSNEYIIHEQPVSLPPSLDKPSSENPTTGKPTSENPTQLNKDRVTKDQSITDPSITHSFPSLSPPPAEMAGTAAVSPPERKRREAVTQSAVEIYRELIKENIVSVFLTTPDDIFVCDPEAEYFPLVQRLHGQIIKLSPTSKDYVNPLDINLNYSEDENPLALKSDFVLSFCELVMGGKNGLEPIEKTVIDRAVQVIYRPYLADPSPEKMPVLSDLHAALTAQHIPEADRVAQALDLYVSGSLNVFNHRTNVDINNRLVCFDIKDLGKQLKKLGMLIVQDQIWGRVTANRSMGKATWYFADEFHLLLKEEQTAAYSAEIWKRFRKWGGIPTGATQNVKDLLSSPEIENILENSDFICLLNQASGDRKILAERLNLSPDHQKYIDNSEPGAGLLIFENVILPFTNPIPSNTELYKIMTTRLSEVVEGGA